MKRGSALLIVLGMLSFMVISAVAFSAFMRFSRLPSSYLRRTSASRHLVKAALAEAIDIVDASIADNPHPGVGTGAISYPRYSGGRVINRNYWRNHVFTGTNILVSADETIATLTLEGLAHLPPALINEARYYSRHSTAGRWHTFGYDSGRFAFCAVDVSDHLNVNKIPADIGRGSLPENRFSLSYVFENDGHTSYTVQPSAWDTFMENYVSFASAKDNIATPAQKGSSASSSSASASKLPLVSIADLNLAANRDGGNFRQYFPFVGYLEGGQSDFVTSLTGPTAEMQKHMAFVTDGYFPTSGGTGADDDYDLADDKYQPFTGENLKENNARVIRAIIDKSTPGATRLRDYIGRLGLVHLWDYLDEDNVPVSLAIPSVERTPMVCGIKPTVSGSSIQVTMRKEDPTGNQITEADLTSDAYPGAEPSSMRVKPTSAGLQRTARYVEKYVLDKTKFVAGIRSGSIKAVVAYPFRRGRDINDPDSFTLDGHVEFFFTTGNMKFRTGVQSDSLHLDSSAIQDKAYKGDGVFHLPLQSQGLSFSNVNDEQSALQEIDFMIGAGGASSDMMNAIDSNPILTVTWSQEQVSVDLNEGNPYAAPNIVWQNSGNSPTRIDAVCGLPPLGADGVPDATFTSKNALLAYLNGGGAKQARLVMALWLRVKNGDGKTVDLVPACLLDDKNFNSINNFQSMGAIGNTFSGQAYPVMRFTCGSAFDFSDTAFQNMNAVDATAAPEGIMCGDPRWNWAPEHWFVDANVSKSGWLQKCGKGVGVRDRDIFMATSDAGYLQSVYELAFLPRLAGDFRLDNEIWGSMESPDDGRDSWATDFAGARNSGLMWTTYRPFARNGVARDDFEQIGLVNDGGGTKLNPYSDNENILMAAFANTPMDWWAASANTDTGVSTSERKAAATFNKKYAFSKMNSNAKFDWEDLERVAVAFKERMQSQTTVNGWMGAYNELWALDGTDENRLMGAELQGDTDELFGVDRKFLYGYWRDCFAVKQQLFLIFVRAEPMMMGGGAIGQTPPQLGARAVALVWRNPHRGSKSYSEDGEGSSGAPANAPHQTRVLMYRQFD